MKIAKYVLIGLAGFVVLALVGAGIFAMNFDPNRYRGDLEHLAKEHTGRTLKLQGPLELAFFPSLGAKVAGLSFSERASDREFLSLESAHAAVALLPLIRGDLIIDRVRIAGLKARIVKDKSGRYNFQDLLEAQERKPATDSKSSPAQKKDEKAAVTFDFAGLSIERAAISYQDLVSGRELALSDLKLATGHIAARAEGRLDFSTSMKGSNPALDVKINLGGDYRFDLEARSFAFSKVDGAVKGRLDKDSIDARISAPRLDISADKATGEALSAEFSLKGPQRSAEVKLKLAGVQGSAKALVFPSIAADIALSGADFPRPMRLPITGSARADLEKQSMNAELSSKFDESSIQVKLGLAKFSPPAYIFDLTVDRLNLDQYLGKPAASATSPSADSPVDLSAIKDLNANGRLQFGALQIKGLKLANVKAEVHAANGRLQISPHSANLYDGTLAGALTLQAEGNRVALKDSLANVAVGPLLRDVAHQDRLEGRGNVTLDVTAAGASVNGMKKSLAGSAKVNLRDGAIKGINLGEILRKARSALGSQPGQAVNPKEKTDFSELSASFTIKNGVAHNEDLDAKAPLFRITGAGDIDIGNSSLNYVAKTAVVASAKGQGGPESQQLAGLTVPVRLSGSFDSLKYEVDYRAVAGDLVKSKLGEKLKEGIDKNKMGGNVSDRLKGLFGR